MNRLAGETSLYLRQHARQPVEWYPWGVDAFEEAARRDLPVLLSIGYSACHWCHVMAHECFDDATVAAALSAGFVSVKVDREERPDVDALYMAAVQAMTGRGGWPMTVMLTPKGEPFFGGTYFPKDRFLQLLTAVDEAWKNRRSELDQNVDALRDVLSRSAATTPADDVPGVELVQRALEHITRRHDPQWGGFGAAPKFPNTMALDLVIRAAVDLGTDDARHIATDTLDAMAAGGMHDHLGGGFARYSTDERWLVPHFEKMLYDQAMMLRTYVHGWLAFGEPRHATVVADLVTYVLRDLRGTHGGFHSAEDADSIDRDGTTMEGAFYLWTTAEVQQALAEHPDLIEPALRWFGLDGEPHHEGRMIPNRLEHRTALVRPPEVERARALLLESRAGRPRPALDDKVLTEWNALMVSALCEAAAAFDRPEWADAAVACAEFLLAELRAPDGRWHRAWHADGTPRARHAALAADHVALIDAFTRLGELTGRARWVGHAVATAEQLLDHFWDPVNGGLFTTADDAEQLVVRQKELGDDATPSANSAATGVLSRLAALTGEQRYEQLALQAMRLLAAVEDRAPASCPSALSALLTHVRGTVEVVIVGDRPDLLAEYRSEWRPDAVVAWGERFDGPLWEGRSSEGAYVCRGRVCGLPVTEPAALAIALRPQRSG